MPMSSLERISCVTGIRVDQCGQKAFLLMKCCLDALMPKRSNYEMRCQGDHDSMELSSLEIFIDLFSLI